MQRMCQPLSWYFCSPLIPIPEQGSRQLFQLCTSWCLGKRKLYPSYSPHPHLQDCYQTKIPETDHRLSSNKNPRNWPHKPTDTYWVWRRGWLGIVGSWTYPTFWLVRRRWRSFWDLRCRSQLFWLMSMSCSGHRWGWWWPDHLAWTRSTLSNFLLFRSKHFSRLKSRLRIQTDGEEVEKQKCSKFVNRKLFTMKISLTFAWSTGRIIWQRNEKEMKSGGTTHTIWKQVLPILSWFFLVQTFIFPDRLEPKLGIFFAWNSS